MCRAFFCFRLATSARRRSRNSFIEHLMPGSTMNPARDTCELTVIVGSLDAETHLPACLESLQSACAGLDAEILVVDGSAESGLEEVQKRFASTRFIAMPRGTLLPALWGRGLRGARWRAL